MDASQICFHSFISTTGTSTVFCFLFFCLFLGLHPWSLPGRDQQTESMHGILELKTVRDRLTLTMIWKGPCWGKSEDAVGSQKRGRQTSLSRRLLGRSGTRVVDEIQERKDSGSTDGRVTLK